MDRIEQGESLTVHRVPASDVIVSGNAYTARIDPLALGPSYIGSDGLVTVKVMSQDANTGALSSALLSLRAVRSRASSAPVWVDATNSAHAVAAGSKNQYAASDTHRRVPISVAANNPVPVQAERLTLLRASAQMTANTLTRGMVPDHCDVGAAPRIHRLESRLRWATIGTTYPIGRSKAHMEVSSSDGASYGIATSMSGRFGTWDVNGSRHTRSGWGKRWLDSVHGRSYRKQIEYRRWKYEYLDPNCNHFHWIPQAETGGTGSHNITRPKGWRDHCVPEAPGPWWRDRDSGSAYTYGESVKFADILGIHLSINRQYSSSQKLVYEVVGRKKLCGSNRWPSYASKIVERYR